MVHWSVAIHLLTRVIEREPMRNVAIRRVKDLDEQARGWIASLFGRELQEEEEITISVFPPSRSARLGAPGSRRAHGPYPG